VIISFYVNGAGTLVQQFFDRVNIGRQRAITSPSRVLDRMRKLMRWAWCMIKGLYHKEADLESD
jgi:hypothetical protein